MTPDSIQAGTEAGPVSLSRSASRMQVSHVCEFPHSDGSIVCSSLYPHYTLPDGRVVHYYRGTRLHDAGLVAKSIGFPLTSYDTIEDIFMDTILAPPMPPHPLDTAVPAVSGCVTIADADSLPDPTVAFHPLPPPPHPDEPVDGWHNCSDCGCTHPGCM